MSRTAHWLTAIGWIVVCTVVFNFVDRTKGFVLLLLYPVIAALLPPRRD